MYRKQVIKHSKLKVNNSYKGERIEQKISRILNNKEPISDGAPRIYTERKDGVRPEYDIRTDRFDIAVEAMDIVAKSNTAKRDMAIGERTYDTMSEQQRKEFHDKYPNSKIPKPTTNNDGGAEPAQGTK